MIENLALDLHYRSLLTHQLWNGVTPRVWGGHLQAPVPPAKPRPWWTADWSASTLRADPEAGRAPKGLGRAQAALPILLIRQVSSAPQWEWETCGERPGVTVRLMGGLSVCAKRPAEKEAAGSRQKATQLSFPTSLPLRCFFLCYPPRPQAFCGRRN